MAMEVSGPGVSGKVGIQFHLDVNVSQFPRDVYSHLSRYPYVDGLRRGFREIRSIIHATCHDP